MRCIFFMLLLTWALGIQAQNRCAVPDPHRYTLAGITQAGSAMPSVDDHRSEVLGNNKAAIIRIPVVVHVLFQNDAQQLSDAQVFGAIDALNRDFRRRNADTIHTPARFRHIAADMQIEFVLAITDPQGKPTSGIVRKPTAVTAWSADDKIKFSARGGADAWDTRSYLNIWVGHMPRALGYATPPGSHAAADGIVVTTSVFTSFGRNGQYDMGRTLVHEAGHWLGLKHIWGDESCGDDGIADTPQQAGFTSGCPSGFLSTCTNGTSGDMYMNFMDFTNDACMNLFTRGQKDKARALFKDGGHRYALQTSIGLQAPFNHTTTSMASLPEPVAATSVKAIQLFPNPAQDHIVIQLSNCTGALIQVVDFAGKIVYAGVANGTPIKLAIRTWPAGLYQVVVAKGAERLVAKLVKVSGQ